MIHSDFLNFLFIFFAYFAIPALLYLFEKKYPLEQIKIIIIMSHICVFVFLLIFGIAKIGIFKFLIIGSVSSFASYLFMKKHCITAGDGTQVNNQKQNNPFGIKWAKILYFILSVLFVIYVNLFFRESNKIFVEEHTKLVTTYECYTTTYGNKYHSGSCQYLYKSAHLTTVYEAKMSDYGKCSRCEPSRKVKKEIYDAEGDKPPSDPSYATILTIFILIIIGVSPITILSLLLNKIYSYIYQAYRSLT